MGILTIIENNIFCSNNNKRIFIPDTCVNNSFFF